MTKGKFSQKKKKLLKKNFADLSGDYADFRKSKACLLQAPYEKTLTYLKGARNGPAAIINASLNLEVLDDELKTETYKSGIHTAPPLKFGPKTSPEEAVGIVEKASSELFDLGKLPVLLGGEHTVSIGAVKAAKKFFGDLSVLYLDAHYDLRATYMGSPYNHACVARRIQDVCPVVEAGVRSLSEEERDFLRTSPANVKAMDMYSILKDDSWQDKVSEMLSENVYVSIDLDVLDPSIMPSVGTPEPGGLGWYETLGLLKKVAEDKNVIGFDAVELSPRKGSIGPDFLAAKLIYRFLGYILKPHAKGG